MRSGRSAAMSFLTELQVREDGWTLFGFGSTGEREAFRQLTSVQGVGGRVALAILSVLDPGRACRRRSRGDKAMVARANGVGPKLAQRIVNELAGKLGSPALAGTAGARRAARRRRRRRPLGPRQSRLQAGRGQCGGGRGRRAGRRRNPRRAGPAGAEEGREMIIARLQCQGRVGKTTLAVNLAWASATLSSRRTLLWDLDAQGGASYILGRAGRAKCRSTASPAMPTRRS